MFPPGSDISGLRNLQPAWEDGERIFYRGLREGVDGPLGVLVVSTTSDPPTIDSLQRLAHEFELRDELSESWAARPLELLRERARTMLVLQDPGGEPLEYLSGTQMEMRSFLRLAISLTCAIGRLHSRNLVHKDIKPANIIADLATGDTWLTGFGIATRLSRERQPVGPPEFIAGTLAYMAPEQTGRMNRSIDSRCDLYSLGITLYQMLTGHLPFTANAPMEWIHCHIARNAIPPKWRRKGVPAVISAIIMKLLAKTPEDRYQTAGGVKYDLQRCLADWEIQGRIDEFPIGDHDLPNRLLIPERLYGRERETELLLASFDRVARSGAPELVLVSGYSGIGKSALVQELRTVLVSSGGLFASGKFDQHKGDIPYAALAQAVQSLIRHLLAKSDADLGTWRDALREALNPLGRLIVDLVPELELIIGDQPPVPEVPPQDAQRRFQLVFRRFIGVFAQSDHPLALFLDDLQWLDVATLDLLEDLLIRSDLRHLLLVGAYRYNEVGASHPLTRKLKAIRHGNARVEEISLAPLARVAVEHLTADAVRCEAARAAPLARLMLEKTGGNPFFLIQFLSALVEEQLLTFDHDKAVWCWDLMRIRAKGYAQNVAELMVDKLGRLPDEVQKPLTELACLGNSAEGATLSLLLGTLEKQVHADLGEAVRLQLIERVDDSYKFVHDRVQEATYALQSDEDKSARHLRIGMTLAAHLSSNEMSEKLYVVANQLNRGITAVTSEAEKERIISANLCAGRRARKATAYQAAIAYLKVARGLLGDEAHPRCGPTAFAVALLRAECEFLVGHLDVAEAQLLVLSHNCPNLPASADVARLRASLYTARPELARAVDVCLEFLRHVAIDWSPHPNVQDVDEERRRVRSLAEGLSADQLLALPAMTNPDYRATMAVFNDLVTPALLTDRNLTDIMLLAAARLTLQHGICHEACYPLSCVFGVLASNSTDAELGFRLSRFGVAVAERGPQSAFGGRALLVFGLHVTPWVRPIRSGQPFMQRGLEMSLAAGDLSFAAYSHRGLVSVRLFCGDPLRDIHKDAQEALAFVEASRIDLIIESIAIQRDLALSLMGRDENNSFGLPRPVEPHPGEGTQPLNAFFSYAAQIQINVLAGHYADALAMAERAEKIAWCARAHQEIVDFRFYTGLAHASAYDTSQPEGREMHVSGLREQHRKLTGWRARIPENFAARQTLLSAEIARIEGRALEAEQLYEEAIGLAREAGFVQIEAIAAERAARFYEARGIRTVVLSYLANARDCYLRWGADAKVRLLDEIYPHLRGKEPVRGLTNTIGTPIEHLELATVLKVSEAVSGEIVLEKLIETLLRTALEHAGAERGLLLLPRGSELRIQAEATTGGASVRIGLCDLPISGVELPESLVLYAERTQESIILDDASASGAFINEAYIHRKHARSVLCLPLMKQDKLVALLYLENSLAPRVFTPARVAVLRFLAGEAATSLDNARLYRELQERESKISRLVDSNVIGIFLYSWKVGIVEANDFFLKTVGYEREDLVSGRLRLFDLTPPEWDDRTARAHAEMKSTGVVQPFEKEYFRKDGSRVPVLIGSVAFDERRDQGVVFVLDLSERKRAEAEAHENELRYRETQMELAHANRVAVMGQLTASIAHEINQPIGASITYANAALSWLRTQPPDWEEIRQALGFIVESGVRAGEVIDRIRALVKKTPPQKDRVDINDAILEVLALIRAEIAKNAVSAKTQLSQGLPPVWGDRVQLQQVMLNLLINAIEAMSGMVEGSRELLISTERTHSDAVLIAVRDSGPGFLPESAERLFESFYTTKPGGLGMGLSICHSIIEAHDGRLWATSSLPHGAVLQFTLPTCSPGRG